MSYTNKQNNNYKMNNFNYLTKNNLKQNDVMNNMEKIMDSYMVKFMYNDIKDDNKLLTNNNNNMVLKEDTMNLNKRNTLYNTKYNMQDNNMEILMFMYEKSSKNRLLYSYMTNRRLKKRFNKKRKMDMSLDLLIKHNQKSLYYLNTPSHLTMTHGITGEINNNNSNYSNLEQYLNSINEGYNMTIKPMMLKYPQMDNKIFNNFIMFRQTKNSKMVWRYYRRLFKKMKVMNHKDVTKEAMSNMKRMDKNICNSSNNIQNLPLNSMNLNRKSLLSDYLLYKRMVGFSLNFSGQYLTKKKKRKVTPYAMSKGPLYNTMSEYNNKYNSLTFNKYPGYMNVYSKSTMYNNTILGKIGLNTKMTLV
uniref:Mitochondrial ribosomal protein VAR1/RPS3 n=1 Tax=Yarrowia alimentaria TaxID=479092 RepID=G4U4T8_9ASCO|nr:mitochondrial ribosomal protein VAR1/RPS3 [Yarrowia alimentaria]CCC29079.1 mitochondrial ribosomal protein VAR1/RPS3 [Yarrowia alimentaria]